MIDLNINIQRAIRILTCAALASGYSVFANATPEVKTTLPVSIQQNNEFRDSVMHAVREAMVNEIAKKETKPDVSMDARWVNGGHPIINWAMQVSVYSEGKQVGEGHVNTKSLTNGLIKATHKAVVAANLNEEQWKKARLKVTFYYPPDSRQYSFVDDGKKSAEFIGNIVPVRVMDTDLIKRRILSEKAYLLRVMDPKMHAFFKDYNKQTDHRPEKLRTIYTASSLFTLLRVNSALPDPVIEENVKPIAEFLLMMQEHTGKNAGAFHYSYNKITRKKDNRFVVGTASKTIFTLLMLNEKTHDPKYLNAAKEAGNWLMTKVDEEGRVNPVVIRGKKKWIQVKKQSFLYSGQVLSALSRLYHVTHDKAYYDKATLIAERFVKHVEKNGPFVGDDFRTPNSVSTSWMVMSLVDYAKINKAPIYRHTISRCAKELVARQANDRNDVFNLGRVVDLISASGNGWVNEVMTVLYPFCQAEKMPGCGSYHDFILNSSRWLMQNVYTPTNSITVKNPEAASGGAIPNFLANIVRTDAVCHGGNSLVGLLDMVGSKEQTLMVLPEMSIEEVLTLLGIGKFPEICGCKSGLK